VNKNLERTTTEPAATTAKMHLSGSKSGVRVLHLVVVALFFSRQGYFAFNTQTTSLLHPTNALRKNKEWGKITRGMILKDDAQPAEFWKSERQDSEGDAKKDVNSSSLETETKKGLKRLAQLSLEDYEWRSSVYKSKEADRRVDDYLAKMMGDEASYVRPMDASDKKIGPLVRFGLTKVVQHIVKRKAG
jgi:hypothetical protein